MIADGTDLAQLFERLSDLTAAAIKQRRVGVLVAERGEAGKRHLPQFLVDPEGFRIETDFCKRAGRAKAGCEAPLDLGVAGKIETAVRIYERAHIEALILG